VQDEQPEQDADGRFEGHQGAEGVGGHLAQGEHLQRVGQRGEQQGQPGRLRQHAGGEVAGRLGDAEDRRGGGRDGDGEREPLDPGEAVADPLGEHDVDGPPGGGEGGEAETGRADVAMPGPGKQGDPGQRQAGPGQCPQAGGPPVVAADGGDGERAEELDGHGGAERDALDGGQEGDGLQSGGDAEDGQRGHVVTTERAHRRAGQGQEDDRAHGQPEPGRSGWPDGRDQVHRQGGAQLNRGHRGHGQRPGRQLGRAEAGCAHPVTSFTSFTSLTSLTG
jgi:hypothetical protein